MRRALVSLLVLGCSGSAPPPASRTKPAESTGTPTTSSPPVTAPQSAIAGVYAKACETECADELAELVTYRDANGAIAVVTVQGSPARCSHPPLQFLGPDGTVRAAIPMQPVVPGSADAKHFDEIRTSQLAGLTKAGTMFCRDVKH